MSTIIERATIARKSIVELDSSDINLKNFFVIDVREEHEFESDHIEGATLVPLREIDSDIGTVISDKTTPILVYCTVGHRSAIAASILKQGGYSNVFSLKGGLVKFERT